MRAQPFLRRVLLALVVFLSPVPPAFAEQSAPAPNNMHVGRAKTFSGTALAIAGAFVMPITSFGENRRIGQRNHDDQSAIGMTMIGGGTALILWGIRDRYKAAHPQVVVGVTVQRSRSFFVQRSW